MGADLFDGEAGDAHPGGGQAEKRVFVHAGKPPTAVADVDAPVVEIAQGLGGEDMRGEEKAVGVGNRGENAYKGENETYIEASAENGGSVLYDKEIRDKPRTRRTKRNV